MTDHLPFIAMVVAVVSGSLLVLWLIHVVRRRNLEKLTGKLQTEAAARGWTVSSEYRDEVRTIQWRGSTDGIEWIAEARNGWIGEATTRSRVNMTRWQTTGLRTSSGVIALMGVAGDPELPNAWPTGDGPVARKMMIAMPGLIAQAIGKRFGEEIGAAIDATKLQRVESAEQRLGGYIVLAEDPAEATRLIERVVAPALTATTDATASAQHTEAFFVVIWEGGVGLARGGAVESITELEPLVRRAVAITKPVVAGSA